MLKKQNLGINPYVANNGSRDQSLTGIGGPRVYVKKIVAAGFFSNCFPTRSGDPQCRGQETRGEVEHPGQVPHLQTGPAQALRHSQGSEFFCSTCQQASDGHFQA